MGFRDFGIVLLFWQLNLYCACVKIVILEFSIVVAHLLRFLVIPIAKTFKLMSFELEEGKIPLILS